MRDETRERELALLRTRAEKSAYYAGSGMVLLGMLPMTMVICAPIVAVCGGRGLGADAALGILGFALLAALLIGLGYAIRDRRRWSFPLATIIYALATVGGSVLFLSVRASVLSALCLVLAPLMLSFWTWNAQWTDRAYRAAQKRLGIAS